MNMVQKIRLIAIFIAMLFVNTVAANDSPHLKTNRPPRKAQEVKPTQKPKTEKSVRREDPEWLGLSPRAKENIVLSMAVGLDSFARAIVNISRDREALTIANYVHDMGVLATSGRYGYLQNVAILYNMQAAIDYGIRYELGVLASSMYVAQGFPMEDLPVNADKELLAMIEKKCRDLFNMETFSMDEHKATAFLTLQNFNLFYDYFNLVKSEDIFQSYQNEVKYCSTKAEQVLAKMKGEPKRQYVALCVLENSAFSFTYMPLILAFDLTEEEREEFSNLLVEFQKRHSLAMELALDPDKEEFPDEYFERMVLSETYFKYKLLCLMADKLNHSKTLAGFALPIVK